MKQLGTLVAILMLPGLSNAQAISGRVVVAQGEVTLLRIDSEGILQVGDVIHEGDTIRTNDTARARLLLNDDSVLDIGPNTTFSVQLFDASPQKRRVSLKVAVGRLWARVAKSLGADSRFEVRTDNAVAGVRGTSFIVDAEKEGDTTVTVLSGKVSMQDSNGKLFLLKQLEQSSFDKQGQKNLKNITKEEAGSMKASVKSSLRLKLPRTQQKLQQLPKGTPRRRGLQREDADDARRDLQSIPPLELDPGAADVTGRTRVRGRIDVRN